MMLNRLDPEWQRGMPVRVVITIKPRADMDPVRSRVRSVGPLVGGLWPFVLANGSGPLGPHGTHGCRAAPFGECVRASQAAEEEEPR
jgi:hypothetical protein